MIITHISSSTFELANKQKNSLLHVHTAINLNNLSANVA